MQEICSDNIELDVVVGVGQLNTKSDPKLQSDWSVVLCFKIFYFEPDQKLFYFEQEKLW